MTTLPVRFLASIFLDATRITPEAESYNKLQEIFGNDIILGTIQELTPTGMQNRIRFESPQQEIIVSIHTGRINIEKLPKTISPDSLGSYSDFCTLCSSLFSEIENKFAQKSNRLSFVTNKMIKDIPDTTLLNISEKLFILPFSPFYNKDNISEWNCRLASKKDQTVNGVEEELNIISHISKVKAQMAINTTSITFDGIQIEMDINTDAENTDYRFEKDDIVSFFNNVATLMDELSSSINEHIGIQNV